MCSRNVTWLQAQLRSLSKPDRTQPCEFCCFFPHRDTGLSYAQFYRFKAELFQGQCFKAFHSIRFVLRPLRAATLPQTPWSGDRNTGAHRRSQCSKHACCALLSNAGIWSSLAPSGRHTLYVNRSKHVWCGWHEDCFIWEWTTKHDNWTIFPLIAGKVPPEEIQRSWATLEAEQIY